MCSLEIYEELNTTFWKGALIKEMKQVHPAIDEGTAALVGCKQILYYLNFGIKRDFTERLSSLMRTSDRSSHLFNFLQCCGTLQCMISVQMILRNQS